MDDSIRKQDRRLFVRELLRPGGLIGEAVVLGFCYSLYAMFPHAIGIFPPMAMALGSLGVYANSCFNVSKRKRFHHKRFEVLWDGCKDRLSRFRDVLGKMRQEQIADLKEMPKTVEAVDKALYAALRRADMVAFEVNRTERGVYAQPPVWSSTSPDPQAVELYRIADRNIAEYRQLYEGVMAGVMRTEAQSAVFMTTLDALRVKMLGYRLVGKSPEVPSQDFLEALGEAKIQLNAIDQALEELDFSLLPKMVAVVQESEQQNQTNGV